MFDISNIMRSSAFRFLNIGSAGSLAPTSNLSPGTDRLDPRRPDRPFLSRWRNLLPLTVRVPIVSGALILVVAIAISRLMMSFVAHEQELGVRQIAAVYLDGIATTVYPHIVARNLTNTN